MTMLQFAAIMTGICAVYCAAKVPGVPKEKQFEWSVAGFFLSTVSAVLVSIVIWEGA